MFKIVITETHLKKIIENSKIKKGSPDELVEMLKYLPVDEDKIVGLIKLMVREGVNDSRDLDEEFWDKFISEYGHDDVRELLEYSDDCVNIPELMDELSDYNNIILCGGGINQCLKEVEIALMSLDKNYSVLTKYTY